MTRNDSEWLGMDKNLSLNFFTRNEVGIWSDSYLFGRIRSDSYHSARIRSECVGEGKVLALVQGTHVRTDGVANSRGQGSETGIAWDSGKKTRRPESYPALVKAQLPVMLRGWEEALGHLVLHWVAAWCETKCGPDLLW